LGIDPPQPHPSELCCPCPVLNTPALRMGDATREGDEMLARLADLETRRTMVWREVAKAATLMREQGVQALPPEILADVDFSRCDAPIGGLSQVQCFYDPTDVLQYPEFYPGKTAGGISVFPEEALGFCALAEGVGRMLMSLPYLGCAETAHQSRYLGPSILLYYSAAYHLLHAYLAVHGRVILDNPCPLIFFDNSDAENSVKTVCLGTEAVIVRRRVCHSGWITESLRRSHERRWKELSSLLIDARCLPGCFRDLFAFFCEEYGLKCPSDRALIIEGCNLLPKARHQALYGAWPIQRSIGLLHKQKHPYWDRVNSRTTAMSQFALSFLEEVLVILNDSLERFAKCDTSSWWSTLQKSISAAVGNHDLSAEWPFLSRSQSEALKTIVGSIWPKPE